MWLVTWNRILEVSRQPPRFKTPQSDFWGIDFRPLQNDLPLGVNSLNVDLKVAGEGLTIFQLPIFVPYLKNPKFCLNNPVQMTYIKGVLKSFCEFTPRGKSFYEQFDYESAADDRPAICRSADRICRSAMR